MSVTNIKILNTFSPTRTTYELRSILSHIASLIRDSRRALTITGVAYMCFTTQLFFMGDNDLGTYEFYVILFLVL